MKFKYKSIKDASYAVLLFSPVLVTAQVGVINILNRFEQILNSTITFFMVLATVIFLWGIITYLTAGGEEEKIRSGRTYMLWGIVSLFVMVAVWGLVAVLGATFTGLNSTSKIPIGPQK